MDLYTLDSNFQPANLIEIYDSLIWTERYAQFGDFKMTSYNPAGVMAKMPLDSCIGINQSKQIMIVEGHSIERDKEGRSVITTTGRTLETVFERRVAANKDGDSWSFTSTAAYMAQYLLSSAINSAGNVMQNSVVKQLGDALTMFQANYDLDTIANAVSTLQTVDIADTYTAVMKTLAQDSLSLRTARYPGSPVVDLRIFLGDDRRQGNAAGNSVVTFNLSAGDILTANYIFSKKLVRNVGYPMQTNASNGKPSINVSAITDRNRLGLTAAQNALLPSGLLRRDAIVDCSQIDVNVVGNNLVNALSARNAAALKSTEQVVFVSATASPQSQYVYGTNYDLGDIVTFSGDYSVVADMQVTEYVRTKDGSGDMGYPTLVGAGTQ